MASAWDFVVLQAGDEAQKVAFEIQMKAIVASLPAGPERGFIDYRVYSDWPPNAKIGGGGGTLVALDALRTEMGEESLCEMRILLLNAGGYCQRQPNASALGKIFSVLPRTDAHNNMYSMLHVKLDSYMPLLKRMRPGVFIAAADALEYFRIDESDDDWTLDRDGFVVLAHPSPPTIAVNHGVYIIDRSLLVDRIISPASGGGRSPTVVSVPVERVLQKPSLELMAATNAIWNWRGQDCVLTDSAYFMSSSVVRSLLALYASHKPITCEVDCYGDFLQPLGKNANMDYLTDSTRVVAGHDVSMISELERIRAELFRVLHPFPVEALVLTNSTFYHIGTLKELLYHFCDPQSQFQSHFGIDRVATKSKLTNDRNQLSAQTRIMGSYLTGPTTTLGKTVIEFSHFANSVDIVEDCVISGCHYDRPLTLTIPLFITTIPIQTSHGLRYVTIAFHLYDDLKKNALKSAISWLDRPLSQSIAERLTDSEAVSLWKLPLFPIAKSMTESFHSTIEMVNGVVSGNYVREHGIDDENSMSMADAIRSKDVNELLNYRANLGALIDGNSSPE
uniref:L-fucokinase domain-containing protein n=1 Tax=Plectus sambesii TaxID=2011161 RepID=A0A914XKL6_9BILA